MIVTVRIKPPWMVRWLTAAENSKLFRRLFQRSTRTLTAGAFLILSAAGTSHMAAELRKPLAVAQTDPRVARLEKFFKSHHCVVPYHVPDYLRAADSFGLDYRLLPAVSIRETSCGNHSKVENNFWGFHPGLQATFPSVEAGIDFLAQRLAQHRLYKGKTLREKLFVYNPKAAYPEEVDAIMRQIE